MIQTVTLKSLGSLGDEGFEDYAGPYGKWDRYWALYEAKVDPGDIDTIALIGIYVDPKTGEEIDSWAVAQLFPLTGKDEDIDVMADAVGDVLEPAFQSLRERANVDS